MPIRNISAVAVLSLFALGANAEGVRMEKNMSLELASKIAAATVAACSADKYNVTATVVDRAGSVRAVMRADNAGPHTLGASQAKAFTAASAKNTTAAMWEGVQKNPASTNVAMIPGFLLLGGGVPVKAGDEVIGAVGVGGAPGGHLDEKCAMAGIASVQDQLK